MTRIYRLICIFSLASWLAIAAMAQSQSTTGTVQGTVVDQNGAVVAGAAITVRNLDTGFERSVTSISDGFFTAPLLPLGRYRITSKAGGFTDQVLENVDREFGSFSLSRPDFYT